MAYCNLTTEQKLKVLEQAVRDIYDHCACIPEENYICLAHELLWEVAHQDDL